LLGNTHGIDDSFSQDRFPKDFQSLFDWRNSYGLTVLPIRYSPFLYEKIYVLKTEVMVTAPWVRIPLFPP
jgi:hypothetical protein